MAFFSRRKFLRGLGGVLGLGGLAAADGHWIEPTWLRVRSFRLPGPSLGLKLVQFTDVHHKGNAAYFRKVIERINSLKPDVVLFTGDLIEEIGHQREALEIIQQVQAPLYGIPGNHDYWAKADFNEFRKTFKAAGGAWLMDEETAAAGGKLNLVGVTGGKIPPFSIQSGARNILLSHYPNWIEKLGTQRFDLTLSGHSHGGQVRLPFYGPLLVPFNVGSFDMGWYETPAGPMYVNPGIGCFYLNIRFNCRPELTVFEV